MNKSINSYLSTEDVKHLDMYCQQCEAWITDPQKHAQQNQHHTLISGTEPPKWFTEQEEEN